jgi:hypothetical protein
MPPLDSNDSGRVPPSDITVQESTVDVQNQVPTLEASASHPPPNVATLNISSSTPTISTAQDPRARPSPAPPMPSGSPNASSHAPPSASCIDNISSTAGAGPDSEALRLQTVAHRQLYVEYFGSIASVHLPGTEDYPHLISATLEAPPGLSPKQEDEYIHAACLSLFGSKGLDVCGMSGVFRSEFYYVVESFLLDRARPQDTLAMEWLGLFIQRTLDAMEAGGIKDQVRQLNFEF